MAEQKRMKDLFDATKIHPRSFKSFETNDMKFLIISQEYYKIFMEAKNPFILQFHNGGYIINQEEIQTTFNNLVDRKEKLQDTKKPVSENAKSEEEIEEEKNEEEYSSNYFICIKDHIAVGLCTIYQTDTLTEISCSYDVLQEFQGKGIGTQILNSLSIHIESLNLKYLKKIRLLIDTRNIGSKRVAEKSGFVIVEKLYARNMFCYIMEKILKNNNL
jgi:RimJ/RimL family protein N-acetyltransferase